MSPEAQRIAIATACGWWGINDNGFGGLSGGTPGTDGCGQPCLGIPQYLTDLNAMHEAEAKALVTTGQWIEYVKNLGSVLMRELNAHGTYEMNVATMNGRGEDNLAGHMGVYIRATAAQRAEAFLRTIGKWTP